jgi:hypothetical protein
VTSAERHVTAVYLVVLAVVLLYVVLYAFKLGRLERAMAALLLTRSEQDERKGDRARAVHDGEA